MNKKELKKHCEKQVNLCFALNDFKHIEEHQTVLDLLQENKQLIKEIRKYQADRDTSTKRHLEVQDYIKSRIQYCKEMTGFDCCIEELEEISKMI